MEFLQKLCLTLTLTTTICICSTSICSSQEHVDKPKYALKKTFSFLEKTITRSQKSATFWQSVFNQPPKKDIIPPIRLPFLFYGLDGKPDYKSYHEQVMEYSWRRSCEKRSLKRAN
ncbi:TPA: hypothetical protein DEG75_00180 [Candidatus Dependentiae bacterium]|nr:hypothetical protein [Candidatus Dependentiae bacterium]